MLYSGCTCGCSAHIWPCPLAASPYVPMTPMQGWVCPVCGGGNSPFASRCPCKPAVPPTYTGITINTPPITIQPTIISGGSPSVCLTTAGQTWSGVICSADTLPLTALTYN